jgi:sucrose-6-phosphate hydrolase SacC (GH32 family)
MAMNTNLPRIIIGTLAVICFCMPPAIGAEIPTASPSPRPDLYKEALRPQFHVTAREWEGYKLNPPSRHDGWLNDINGLVYYAGEYHAFAQQWNRCWLHFVSRDLLHWTELRPAFWEDKQFGGVQSGSAVIDKTNTSGLATGKENAVMVAFWASTMGTASGPGKGHTNQCISYSNDRGRTWTKYDKNPVLPHADRDPKVFWYEPEKKWVMVLFGPPGGYLFFSSKDLRTWQEMSFLPGYFECPDMFELPLDGDRNRMKWVVVNGNGEYVVGDFDGTTFKPETSRRSSCGGPNFYATQTFNNMEEADGRRIQLAWMAGGSYPNMPFNQQMSFPCELTLRSHAGSMWLYRNPIKEVESLHLAEHKWEARTIAAGEEMKLGPGELLDIKANLELKEGTEGTIRIRGENIRVSNDGIGIRDRNAEFFDGKDGDGRKKPTRLKTLEILVDRTSIEVFGNDGEASLAACFLPSGDDLSIQCSKGEIEVRSLVSYEMESIWKDGAGNN